MNVYTWRAQETGPRGEPCQPDPDHAPTMSSGFATDLAVAQVRAESEFGNGHTHEWKVFSNASGRTHEWWAWSPTSNQWLVVLCHSTQHTWK